MRNATRNLFTAYAQQVATISGVADAAKTFSVEPSVQQTVEKRIQESSEFLGRINIVGVEDLKGEKVGIGVSGTIAGRTDTSVNGQRRNPRDVSALDSTGYECSKTDFDTAIRYALLDAWAHQPNFQILLRDAIVKQQALDRLMIGFHGTSIAADTNRAANPLLQDVNKGWLQHQREDAPDYVLTEVEAASGTIKVGATATAANGYKNLDALVYDAIGLLDPWYRKRPDLIVIAGRDLVHDKYFPMINSDQPATEKLATDLILSQKRMGGLQVVEVPYMPDGALAVTSLQNLSIYYQIGGRRRSLREEPEYNRVANYESSNDAYVVEDKGLLALVENIEIVA